MFFDYDLEMIIEEIFVIFYGICVLENCCYSWVYGCLGVINLLRLLDEIICILLKFNDLFVKFNW